MPFTTPYTFTALELVTAALLNGMQDNASASNADIVALQAVSETLEFCTVYKSTTQNFSSGAALANITWNAEVSDSNNWHDNSTNSQRITVTVAGTYIPFVKLHWVKDSGGDGTIFHIHSNVQLNGSDTVNGIYSPNTKDATSKKITFGGIPVSATASQYFTVQFTQDSGGTGTLYGSTAIQSSFSLIKIA